MQSIPVTHKNIKRLIKIYADVTHDKPPHMFSFFMKHYFINSTEQIALNWKWHFCFAKIGLLIEDNTFLCSLLFSCWKLLVRLLQRLIISNLVTYLFVKLLLNLGSKKIIVTHIKLGWEPYKWAPPMVRPKIK